MAEFQKIREGHADWQDKVVIVPVSIDDTLQEVQKHLVQRGWTNTFNVWAGDGGWHAAPAKAFRVSGVPTTYVINTQGKIEIANQDEKDIAGTVDGLLKR